MSHVRKHTLYLLFHVAVAPFIHLFIYLFTYLFELYFMLTTYYNKGSCILYNYSLAPSTSSGSNVITDFTDLLYFNTKVMITFPRLTF